MPLTWKQAPQADRPVCRLFQAHDDLRREYNNHFSNIIAQLPPHTVIGACARK